MVQTAGTSFVKTKRMKGFTTLLISAACEWFLIFLLLVDAVLSYLLTKFASYCQLQLPCLLCSRLDHIFGNGKPELYQKLFCNNHKAEMSSLVLCHVHGMLGDGHKMCDDCLLSFSTHTKHKQKTQRLLVGKLGPVLGGSGFQSPPLSKDLFSSSKVTRTCACCGKLWKSAHNPPRSIQPGRAILKPYIPLSHVPRQSRLNHRDDMKKIKDKSSGSEGKSSFRPLPRGYTVLKITSESESEFPFSDDDDVASVFHENNEAVNDSTAQMTPVTPPKRVHNDLNPEKPNLSSPEHRPLGTASKHQNVNDNGLVEINQQQANQKLSSDLPELISLDEVSPSPIVVDVSNRESESEKSKFVYIPQNSLLISLSELMTLDAAITPVGASSEKSVDVAQAHDTGMISEKHGKDSKKIGREDKASTETDPMVCDSVPVSPRQENSSTMSAPPVTTKVREEPSSVMEQPMNEEVNKVKEKLDVMNEEVDKVKEKLDVMTEEVDKVKEKLDVSPSHSSSSHGSNESSVDTINHVHSPRRHDETSSSNGIQALQKSASVESDIDSLDESNIAEIEGESVIDRLKREIEYDKKCIDTLHKELEEERNASAIATNEAMSMITRLQEEKATLQMEAHQYLRMMEEQAEYDNEELDKVNDLLTEKEKEIQDLEAELEFYRLNSTDEPMVHNMHEESRDSKGEKVTARNIGLHNITDTGNHFSPSKFAGVSKISDEGVAGRTFLLELEEEKLYILQCLKNLEKKFLQNSTYEISSHTPTVRPENIEFSELYQQGASNGEEPHSDSHEETDLSIQKDITSNGNHNDKDDTAASDCDGCSLGIENNHSTSGGPKTSIRRKEIELVALENEISDLNDRLEALEFDHDLLEHIINFLQNGNDGKQFIQDIVHQLDELRKIGIRSRCVSDVMQNQKTEKEKKRNL